MSWNILGNPMYIPDQTSYFSWLNITRTVEEVTILCYITVTSVEAAECIGKGN